MSRAQIEELNDSVLRANAMKFEAEVELLLSRAVAEGRVIVWRGRTQDFATFRASISAYFQGHGVNDVDVCIIQFIKLQNHQTSHFFQVKSQAAFTSVEVFTRANALGEERQMLQQEIKKSSFRSEVQRFLEKTESHQVEVRAFRTAPRMRKIAVSIKKCLSKRLD